MMNWNTCAKTGSFRKMRRLERNEKSRVSVDGCEALLLCSNNYLGLADHPTLKKAAIMAAERFGVGSGASRLVSGSMELHEAWKTDLLLSRGLRPH